MADASTAPGRTDMRGLRCLIASLALGVCGACGIVPPPDGPALIVENRTGSAVVVNVGPRDAVAFASAILPACGGRIQVRSDAVPSDGSWLVAVLADSRGRLEQALRLAGGDPAAVPTPYPYDTMVWSHGEAIWPTELPQWITIGGPDDVTISAAPPRAADAEGCDPLEPAPAGSDPPAAGDGS